MEDVSSLAALVAAASPPSERGTLKRYVPSTTAIACVHLAIRSLVLWTNILSTRSASFLFREVSAADLASDLASEGVSEPTCMWSPHTGATMGEAAALLVLSGDDQGEL